MSELILSDVAVTYGDRRAVLPFTDKIAAGKWVGLIGPNGAGKSSLMRSIAGLVKHDGSISVDGDVLSELSDRERARRVAYVPQEPLTTCCLDVTHTSDIGRASRSMTVRWFLRCSSNSA